MKDSVERHRERGKQEHRRMRDSTIKRLGGKCSVCGTTENLEIHHKKPYLSKSRPHSWKYYNDSNLELLCRKHHFDKSYGKCD